MALVVMTLSALVLFTVVDDGAWKLVASQALPADGGADAGARGQN
jgi:hypothetical protein